MKKSLLLLKALLEPGIIKSRNMLLQFQKMYLIDKIDNIVDKYNNTYHSAISIRPADEKSSTYIDLA